MNVTRKPRRAWPWGVAVAIALPMVYVLSIGPVIWVEKRVVKSGYTSLSEWYRVRQTLYGPLLQARDYRSKAFHDFYWWYLGMWVDVHPPSWKGSPAK
jgi:hypothetical protein